MQKNEISSTPLFADLRVEIRKLQEELAQLLLEKEELRVACRKILAEYFQRFGELECKVTGAECEYLRMKRLMEMVQMRLNREEEISLDQILEKLIREFARYQEALEKILEQVEASGKSGQQPAGEGTISPEEAEKEKQKAASMKKIYREIVKRLHPDMNPNQSEEEAKLFRKAMEAYEKEDRDTLELIYGQLGDIQGEAETGGETGLAACKERLERQRDLLKNQIEKVKEEIRQLKEAKPYILKEYLEDPEKARKRRRNLEVVLQNYEEQIREYKKVLANNWVVI